jgi:lambda repressor-like predicted transcriptional regulator
MTPGPDLSDVIARNLAFLMEHGRRKWESATALANEAKISPNTLQNMLTPGRRRVSVTKTRIYPTLDKLAAVAGALGCEPWELLHPNLEQARLDREALQKVRAAMARDTENEVANVPPGSMRRIRPGEPLTLQEPAKAYVSRRRG